MTKNQKFLSLKVFSISTAIVFSIFIITGCNWSNTAKGGVGGAVGGAAVGGAISKMAGGSTATGAIIGAVVGGAAGATIGRYMDKQAEEIEADLEGAEIERVGEGIKITFDSGLLFDVDKSTLKAATKTNLQELSETLQKYEDTQILVEGHTDASGSDEHNQGLSERRAQAVADYIVTLGVDPARINTKGYGESQPIADNETTAGKAANRGVEMAIFANEKLKKAAERGEQIDPQ